MAGSADQLREHVENELRPYGQFLAMRGALPGEQRFGIPEVALAGLSLIGWALAHYVKSLLTELGKLHAKSVGGAAAGSPEPAEKTAAALDARLEGLRGDLRGLEASLEEILADLRDIDTAHPSPRIEEPALRVELQRLGLTDRAAGEAAPRLARVLADGLGEVVGRDLGR